MVFDELINAEIAPLGGWRLISQTHHTLLDTDILEFPPSFARDKWVDFILHPEGSQWLDRGQVAFGVGHI
jgi:hypothetical protein